MLYNYLWVVLKVQNGGDNRKRKLSKKKVTGGNVAVGLLLFLLAYYVYPSNVLLAFGIGLVGLYVIFGGR